jgi:hypothetical protein
MQCSLRPAFPSQPQQQQGSLWPACPTFAQPQQLQPLQPAPPRQERSATATAAGTRTEYTMPITPEQQARSDANKAAASQIRATRARLAQQALALQAPALQAQQQVPCAPPLLAKPSPSIHLPTRIRHVGQDDFTLCDILQTAGSKRERPLVDPAAVVEFLRLGELIIEDNRTMEDLRRRPVQDHRTAIAIAATQTRLLGWWAEFTAVFCRHFATQIELPDSVFKVCV